jgi:hypothetical protein
VPAGVRQSPQGDVQNALHAPGIPAYPRLDRKRRDRPVTPEVAGSSPVAPVVNSLQLGVFCCLVRRKRPPVFTHLARIRHET